MLVTLKSDKIAMINLKKIFAAPVLLAALTLLTFQFFQKPEPVKEIQLSSIALWPFSIFQNPDFKKAPQAVLENGGTVFSIANFGTFLDPKSKFYNAWDSNGWDPDFYSIARGYHLYKNQVDSTMKSIKDGGQSKIGMLLWFIGNHPENGSLGHVIATSNGKLYQQHRKNLQDFVKKADELGFNEVQVRFASQGDADVFGTKPENMVAQIEQHWTLIKDTHEAIAEMKLKVKVIYDLGVELAAHPYTCRAEVTGFLTEIWKRYSAQYGVQDTIGFSWNHADDCGARQIIDIYQKVGVFPIYNGLDVYGSPGEVYSVLKKIAKILDEKGLKQKMAFSIQETWYNDAAVAAEVNQAVQDTGIKIKYIMQWPLKRGSKTIHFSETAPSQFDAYKR